MFRIFLVVLFAMFLVPVARSAPADNTPSDSVEEMCKRALDELKPLMVEFRELEKNKSASYEPPPVWTHECRGKPAYQKRDAREDTEKKDYVYCSCDAHPQGQGTVPAQCPGTPVSVSNRCFMESDRPLLENMVTHIRHLQELSCELGDNQEPTSTTLTRIGNYMARRVRRASLDFMKLEGTLKFDTVNPLIAALIETLRRASLFSSEEGNPSWLEQYVFPMQRALILELMRRVSDEHDLRILQETLIENIRLGQLFGPLEPELADYQSVLMSLFRFKVSVASYIGVPAEQGQYGAWSSFQNHLLIHNPVIIDRTKPPKREPHYNPSRVNYTYDRVINDEAQFKEPPRFHSRLDLDFDVCAEQSTAYVFFGEMSAPYESFLYPGDDSVIELPGVGHDNFPDLVEAIRQPVGERELDLVKLKFPVNNREVKVIKHKLSHSRELPEGGVMATTLDVTVTHTPSR